MHKEVEHLDMKMDRNLTLERISRCTVHVLGENCIPSSLLPRTLTRNLKGIKHNFYIIAKYLIFCCFGSGKTYIIQNLTC